MITASAVVLAACWRHRARRHYWTPPVGDDGQLDLSAINIVSDDAAETD